MKIEKIEVEECSRCGNFFNPEKMEEVGAAEYCSECAITERAVKKLSLKGVNALIVIISDHTKRFFKYPFEDLSNLIEVFPSDVGLNSKELLSSLYDYEMQTTPEQRELFEFDIKLFDFGA